MRPRLALPSRNHIRCATATRISIGAEDQLRHPRLPEQRGNRLGASRPPAPRIRNPGIVDRQREIHPLLPARGDRDVGDGQIDRRPPARHAEHGGETPRCLLERHGPYRAARLPTARIRLDAEPGQARRPRPSSRRARRSIVPARSGPALLRRRTRGQHDKGNQPQIHLRIERSASFRRLIEQFGWKRKARSTRHCESAHP